MVNKKSSLWTRLLNEFIQTTAGSSKRAFVVLVPTTHRMPSPSAICAPMGRRCGSRKLAKPNLTPLGALHAVRGLTRDITERRRVEAELSTARKQAELANRAKSSFLSA